MASTTVASWPAGSYARDSTTMRVAAGSIGSTPEPVTAVSTSRLRSSYLYSSTWPPGRASRTLTPASFHSAVVTAPSGLVDDVIRPAGSYPVSQVRVVSPPVVSLVSTCLVRPLTSYVYFVRAVCVTPVIGLTMPGEVTVSGSDAALYV